MQSYTQKQTSRNLNARYLHNDMWAVHFLLIISLVSYLCWWWPAFTIESESLTKIQHH